MNRLPGVVLLLLAAALASGCGGTGGWTEAIRWSDAGLQGMPDPAAYPDAGAVVLLDDGSMEIFGGAETGFSVFERHRIVRILNQRGHRYANVMIPYGGSSIVDNLQARTISPGGRVMEVKPEDIFDVGLYPGYVFFSDQRARIFTMPAVEDGAIIEYRYRVQVHDRTFWHSWIFQDEEPVLLSRFTLVKPGEWNVAARSYGIPVEPTVTKAPAGFKSRHVWELRNVPPLHAEAAMPPGSEIAARIALAPVGFTSWRDVSRWYYDIAAGRMKGGALVRSIADSLTRGITDPGLKLQAVFEWVRKAVRYIAVEIGIGGYQPHDAEEIAAKKYGDCKDMVTVLCALTRAAGIEAEPAMISTWHNGRPDTSLPSPLQFNHLIAFAPGIGPKGTWMDATDKACPFGTLPWYDQGTPVILARTGDADAKVITPAADPAQNRAQLAWDVALATNGSARVRGSSTFTGAPANELRYELSMSDKNEQRRWMEAFLARRSPGAELDSCSVSGVDTVRDPLLLSYTFHTGNFARIQDSTLMLRPGNIADFVMDEYFRSPTRTYPIRFRFGSHTDIAVDLKLPAGWRLRNAAADSAKGRHGSATWAQQRTVDGLSLRLTHTLNGGEVPAAEYREFRDFLDAVRRGDDQPVLIDRGTR